MADSLFKEPRKVLRWARKEIARLIEAGDAFLETKPYEVVEERDLLTNDILIVLRILKGTPDEIEERSYRAVGDLRNALDQACHAASVALGSADPDRANFPMCESLAGLKGQLNSAANGKGPYRGIPVQLHPKLVQLKPFWSEPDNGNHLLRGLGDIANPNKHRLPVRSRFDSPGMGLAHMEGLGRFVYLNEWNALKAEFIIARMTPLFGQRYRYKLNVKVAHSFADGPLLNKPLGRTLVEMADAVERVIDALEAETTRLLTQ